MRPRLDMLIIMKTKYMEFLELKYSGLKEYIEERNCMDSENSIILSEAPFISFQGEAGQPGALTLFIRTFGCINFCKNCDTKFSWNTKHVYSYDSLVEIINKFVYTNNYNNTGKFIINFTGGEPLQYIDKIFNIIKLSRKDLDKNGYNNSVKFVMETSGNFENEKLHNVEDSIYYLSLFDELNISPKTPCMQAEKQIDMDKLKYIIDNTSSNSIINLKFVVKEEHDVLVIQNILNNIKNFNNIYVYLMPLTDISNKTTSDKIKSFVSSTAISNGWSYSPRLHIDNNFK